MSRKGFLRSIFSTNAFSQEKGFIFTIDALFAIVVIVAASIAFFFLVQKTDAELLNLQDFRIKTNDEAIVNFYLGLDNSRSQQPDLALDQIKTGYCAESLDYLPDTIKTQQATTAHYYYCEVRP